MSTPSVQFDDPSLKQAVRRAAGNATADPALRSAMEALVRRETQVAGVIRPAAASRWRIGRVAAIAASLLVALGTTAYVWHRHHEAAEQAEYLAANLPLFKAMIEAESKPTAAGDGSLNGLALTDRAAVAKELSTKLGRPVPVPDWAAKGWRLSAVAVSTIGKHVGAQLRYQQGGRTLTLVSLPAAAYTGEEGEEPEPYNYVVDGHVICGLVRDGGLHCIVGDAHVTPDDVADLKLD